MTMSWNQPTCERCWINLKAEVYGDDVAIPVPVMVRDSRLECCSYCGAPTFVGIYTRADPATVKYPKEETE